MSSIDVEICANSVESALAAQEGGASRVELCDNLAEGGTTPSEGTIRLARERLSIGLHVLIRPRGGDFLYSPLEMDIMRCDIGVCQAIGVDGVVLGCLLPDGRVDVDATNDLVQAARPLHVTFHRAIDVACRPLQALEDVIRSGCDRVLTSGRAQRVIEGAGQIAEWVQQSNGRVRIMAGSGVSPANVGELVEKTGVTDVHLSAQAWVKSGMSYHHPDVSLGGNPDQPEQSHKQTDARIVREVVDLVRIAQRPQA